MFGTWLRNNMVLEGITSGFTTVCVAIKRECKNIVSSLDRELLFTTELLTFKKRYLRRSLAYSWRPAAALHYGWY